MAASVAVMCMNGRWQQLTTLERVSESLVMWIWKSLSAYGRITIFVYLVLKWIEVYFTEVRYTVTKFLSPAKHVPSAEKRRSVDFVLNHFPFKFQRRLNQHKI
jgi:hypothetical protein